MKPSPSRLPGFAPDRNILVAGDPSEILPGMEKPWGLSAPGLLVLDLMRLFCDPHSPAYLPAFSGIRERLFNLTDIMIEAGRPVLFTRHAHEMNDDGGLIGRLYGRLQRTNDPFNELIPDAKGRIPPALEKSKNRYSPLYDEATARLFEGCDSILICGVQTHACVLASAIDCSRIGIVPLIVADACASKSGRLHHGALAVMASGHAFVLEAREALALFSLRGSVP